MVSNCKKTCESDDLDCYVLDNNGFVLLSEKTEHTGKFFGQIDGTIMDSLVQDRIYRRVPVMDYQGICSDKDNPYRAAGDQVQPSTPMKWIVKYFATYLATWFSFFVTPHTAWPHYDEYEYREPTYDEDTYVPEYPYGIEETTPSPGQTERVTSLPPKASVSSSGPRVVPDAAHARACDLSTDLYLLQPERLNQSGQNNPLKVSPSLLSFSRFLSNFFSFSITLLLTQSPLSPSFARAWRGMEGMERSS